MARNHYETLGLTRAASQAEIKSAYRRLVLLYHPDRSTDAASLEAFHAITAAYEVIGDRDRRIQYDRLLEMPPAKAVVQPRAAAKHKTKAYAATGKAARSTVVSAEVTRLTLMHSRGQSAQAERLAQRILGYDSRQPIPYAVLADISRAKGELKEAARLYALAVQLDPGNDLYHQRHEEMISLAVVSVGRRASREKQRQRALWAGAGMLFLSMVYLIVSREEPLLPELSFVSSWTLGVVVMSFLSGVAVGVSMCYAGLLDRFFSVATTALGRITPVVALASIAIVNFWIAAAIYALLGFAQNSFNFSTTRLVSAVGGATLLLAFAAQLSWALNSMQVLAWSGNLVYMGALCGWMVADSMRE